MYALIGRDKFLTLKRRVSWLKRGKDISAPVISVESSVFLYRLNVVESWVDLPPSSFGFCPLDLA